MPKVYKIHTIADLQKVIKKLPSNMPISLMMKQCEFYFDIADFIKCIIEKDKLTIVGYYK